MVFDSAKGEIYVANENSESIGVISSVTDSVVDSISDFGAPYALAYDSGTGQIFVSNYAAGTVSVINDTMNTIVANVTVGRGPDSIAYDPAEGELFVANQESQTVSVINDTNDSVVDTIGPYVGGNGNPELGSALYDAYDGEILVPAYGYLDIIDDANNSVTDRVYVGTFDGAVLDTAQNEVYVAGDNAVAVISLTNDEVTSVLSYPNVDSVGYDPQMGDVYVMSAAPGTVPINISVVSDVTNTAVANLIIQGDFPSGPIYDPATGQMFESSASNNGVSWWVTVLSPIAATARPAAIDLGGSTVINITSIKSAPTLSYQYAGLPDGCPTSNTASLPCTPTVTGVFLIRAYANDTVGPAMYLLNLTVNPPLSLSSFAPSTNPVNVGTPTNLTLSYSGGTAPFAVAYSGLPPGCTSDNATVLPCTPTVTGSYVISAKVTDAAGSSIEPALTLSVVDTGPVVSLSGSTDSIDVGQSIVLQSHVVGGESPYTFLYTPSSPAAGCTSSTAASVACVPTSPGSFSVSVTVTDSLGVRGSASSPGIQVSPALTVTLSVSNTTPLLGQTVAFVANASGGLGTYTYSYSGFPPGCVSENKSAVGCLPTQADFYNITAQVTDQNEATATATVEMHVIFDFNVVVPSSVSAGSPFTISVNTNESFSAGTAGVPATGFGALTYNYTGLPPGCASVDAASLTCTTTQVGAYHIVVSVHDQAGDHNTHTVVVNVVAANSGFLGFAGDTGYLIVGAGVAVAAALAAVLVVTRARHRRHARSIDPNKE